MPDYSDGQWSDYTTWGVFFWGQEVIDLSSIAPEEPDVYVL
jgi:hypothetical protein